ncbi:MAG TPA: polysaccharide deacetylase family protein [Agromyces sp.]|nr:polysaccharide deacetylase family protein [Agromyces sp.]
MPRGREGARRRVPVVVAIAGLATVTAFSGCAVDDIAPPPSSPPASTGAPPVPEPAGPPLAAPRVVPAPPRLGPDRTVGLVPRLAAMRTDAFAVSARWATPPGSTVLGDALTARVAQAVRAYADEHGSEWQPGVDLVAGGVAEPCWGGSQTIASPAALTVDCAVVAAAGSLVGERITLTRHEPGAAPSVSREVWYADGATGGLFDGASLYRPGQEARVLALVAEGLRAAGRIAPGEDPFAGRDAVAQRAALADSALARSGIVVTLPVESDGGRLASVHVPARLLGPMLSDVGRAALDAVAGGAAYAPDPAAAGDDPVDCTLVPCMSITFDDGPSSLTPALLDVLDRERAPATFFVQGSAVATSPAVAERIVESGHEIGNHTWRHPNLTKLTDDEEVRREVERTQAAIAAAIGTEATSLRPPYGASDERVRALVGLPVIVWDVDTRDWQDPGPDAVVERAVGGSARGSIVLMHDTHEQTVEAVPAVVEGLRDRGFTLATVTEQFGGALPGAGTLVSHGPR